MNQTFEKRPGATDRGRDYEHLYITNIILKLLKDDSVANFYISSNDKSYGSFDDVVITVVSQNGNIVTHAVQLKHSKNKTLRCRDLEKPTGNFSISEYYKDFTNKNLKCQTVLYTNCKAQLDFEIQCEGEKIQVCKVGDNEILVTNPNGSCYQFLSKNPQMREFFANFTLYVNQADVENLEKATFRLFADIFKSDESVFKELVNFVVKWSVKEGTKEKLDKKWMQKVIAIRIFAPFTKPLVFCQSEVSNKEKILSTALLVFPVTTINKNSYPKVKRLWLNRTKDLPDLIEINKVRKKYQIAVEYIKTKEEFNCEDKEKSKLLWLLDVCPLLVEECPGFLPVWQLLEAKNIIVISTKTIHSWFQHLKQKDTKTYSDILTTFTFSLEGQKEALLKDLIHLDQDFHSIVTTDKLVEMLEAPLLIGDIKEHLPESHIKRSFWSIVVDPQFLANSGGVVVVSGVEEIDSFRVSFFDYRVVLLQPNLTLEKSTSGVVYLTTEEFSWSRVSSNHPCHHFRYRNKTLEWITSTNIRTLKNYRLDHEYTNPVDESEIFDVENDVNLVCANSGMGKSTLMKSLKKSSTSSTWTVLITASSYGQFCRQSKPNATKFLEHVWTQQCSSYQNKEVFKMLVLKKQVRIIWDGLDEVTSDTLEDILAVVQKITKEGLKQWLTSRNNLKPLLESRFQTFSRRIREFDGEDQRVFIEQRLKFTNSELMEVFKKVNGAFSGILGIPLQIYMVTELLQDRKYLELLASFTVVDVYQHFVRNKFFVYYSEKLKIDLSIEPNFQKFEEEMLHQMQNYKRAAFNLHLGGRFSYFLSRDEFLKTVEAKGDPVGFISEVTNDDPKFVHNSFGEYFAALYLFEHDPSRAKDSNFVQNEAYNNIRFFLDLMIVKSSKAHIAVLYKNSTLLDECTQYDLDQKDNIDRSTLELSCAWSRKYQIAKVQKLGFGRFNIHSNFGIDDAKRLQFSPISRVFTKINFQDLRLRKLLLLLPFLTPLFVDDDQQCCAMLIYYCIIFDHVVIFRYIDDLPVLKRCYDNFDARFLLSAALIYQSHNCLEEFVLKKEFSDVLQHDLEILLCCCRNDNEDMFGVLAKNIVDINEVIVFACRRGHIENVKFLLKKAETNSNLLHHACSNETDGLSIVKFLIQKGENVNSVDSTGRLPLHYSCMNYKFSRNISWLLLDNHSKINTVDDNKRTPLHYSCDNEECGYETTAHLITMGAEINTADVTGRLPIHYACLNWKFGSQIVQLLVERCGKMAAVDQNGCTPLHYACRNYFRGFEIVQLLVKSGIDVNTPDFQNGYPVQYACECGMVETAKLLIETSSSEAVASCIHSACKNYTHGHDIVLLLLKTADINMADQDGRTPLHLACQYGKPETVKLLVQNRAKINVLDGQGRLPLHYSCLNMYHSGQIVDFLIKANSRVGVADKDGRLPVHIACENGTLFSVMLVVNKSEMSLLVPDRDGRMPIHFACCNYNNGFDIVRYLTTMGASVNCADGDGCVPMHYACRTGSIFIVQLLVELGAKVNVVDKSGLTPMDYARNESNYNVVALMAKASSSV